MFKRKGRNKKPTVIETITKLKQAQTTFEKRAEHNRALAATRFKEAAVAKKNGNKDKAIALLKRRKRCLAQAEEADNHAFMIDDQVNQLRSIAQMKTVSEALELARQTSENLLKKLDIDKIEKLRSDLEDQKYRGREIGAVLTPLEEDENFDLEEEFKNLGEEENERIMIGNMPQIAHAQNRKKVVTLSEEERLLAELEGSEYQPPEVVTNKEEELMNKELELLGAKLSGNTKQTG